MPGPTDLISKVLPALYQKPTYLGVDISQTSLKLVLLRQDYQGSAVILDYAVSEISSKESVSQAISEFIKKNNTQSCQIKFAVSGQDVDSKRITLPYMPAEEISSALRYQAKEHFLINVDESLMDFELLQEIAGENNTRNIEVIASIAKKSFIEGLIGLFKDTKPLPSVVLPSGYCLCNIFNLSSGAGLDEPVALADIGNSITTLSIVRSSKVVFVRQIPMAGEDFTRAMTGALVSDEGRIELNEQQAEELKRSTGIPPETENSQSARQIGAMLRPVVEKLSLEIKRSLDYYALLKNEKKVQALYIAGGSAKMKNLAENLSSILSIKVQDLAMPEAPQLGFGGANIGDFNRDFPRLVLATGAAIARIDGTNLIPQFFRSQIATRMRNTITDAAVSVLWFIILVSFIFTSVHQKAIDGLLHARKNQWQRLYDIETMYSKIKQKDQIVANTIKNQAPIYYILKRLSNIVPGTVYFDDLIMSDKASRLIIRGVALDTQEEAENILAGLIKEMEASELFDEVMLKSTQDTEANNKPAIDFEISCKLEQGR